MFNHRKNSPGSIIGGDFNCVENPIFDVVKKWRHTPEPTRRTNERKKKPAIYFIKYMATEPGHTPEKPLK